MAVTTYRTKKEKPFSWSYSKLKNYESCPKRHYHIDVARDVKEEDSEQLKWGNSVHSALAARIAKGTPLPSGMNYEHWCSRILASPSTILLVEQKLAIKKDFTATTWYGDDAWYRGIGDVVKINGRVALIIDWKTGKILEDSVQLALMAACVFAHYPDIVRVRSEFVWLKEDATTSEVFAREHMVNLWKGLWPRIESLEQAAVTVSYAPRPGRLCRAWCPVKACPHWGESH